GGAASLRQSHGAGESDRDRGQSQPRGRAVDAGEGVHAVSTACRAHRQHGEPALRRRAPDAGDRPAPHDPSAATDSGRSDARLGPEGGGGWRPLIGAEIWQGLKKLRAAGQSTLVTDKNVQALLRIADRHYLIERGKVVWTGSSAALAAAPDIQHRFLGV